MMPIMTHPPPTQDIVTPAWDTDGRPGSFSSAEKADIIAVWRAVSEDFAVFDIDVTTEDPGGVDWMRKSGSSDASYGRRICIGGTSESWLGVSIGGMAYVSRQRWRPACPAGKGRGGGRSSAAEVSRAGRLPVARWLGRQAWHSAWSCSACARPSSWACLRCVATCRR
jgi:hypothetical protein